MRIELAPAQQSVVAIAAHSDDIERWCAGTLAQARDACSTIRLLLVTAGDQGSADPEDTREAVAARREVEAREAAALLDIVEVECLHYPDSIVTRLECRRPKEPNLLHCQPLSLPLQVPLLWKLGSLVARHSALQSGAGASREHHRSELHEHKTNTNLLYVVLRYRELAHRGSVADWALCPTLH
jgi:LmbE family N-acetylglucosaminyl deacetylase